MDHFQRQVRCNFAIVLAFGFVLLAGLLPIDGRAQDVGRTDADMELGNTEPGDTELKVAVLAYRGTEHALRHWTTTMAYLTTQVPGYRFRAIPMSLSQLDRSVTEGSVDFVITNAGQFVRVGSKHGMSGLATLKSLRRRGHGPVIGAALVVRAGSSYTGLDDLEDARLGAVDPLAFGGYQIYWGEMARQGKQPEQFFSDISFSGFPVDVLAYWVRDRQVDAAVLPACLLETMIHEGLIQDADFRILDVKPVKDYDCRTSTPLYPNWFFASLRATSQAVAEQVAQALMTLPSDSQAVLDTASLGWTAPTSSYDIHQLYDNLDIHPWQKPLWLELKDWLAKNWQIGLGFSLLIVAIILHHLWVQYVVLKRTRDLRKANEKLIYQQQQLEHAQRVAILGELSSDLAHELNQPLTAINSFAEGGIVRLERAAPPIDLKVVLDKIRGEAQRGRSIIERVRGFARKQDATREFVDLTELIGETLALLNHELMKQQPELKIVRPTKTIKVCIDAVEIQQLLVNLIRNGVEAMSGVAGPHQLRIVAKVLASGDVELSIEDSGTGICDKQAETLFKPFYSSKSSGLGLGLSICRRIVEAHNGTIIVEPNAMGGTRVVCTLSGESDG
ncbi:MAG: PhnD/SsuA/transferrin family substrate-binding protein [Magnetovibrio sp.]|nr:PhnD/SsuA/transferrin family substrate-binding protein [Magnetovibrio sp.]